ncbi:MarR family winged helix-turn-helix transcriptional regulator [Bosea thiooxidans]
MSKKSNAGPAESCPEPEGVPEAFFGLACTNAALRRATRRLGQLYDDAMAPLGLKATQFGLLVAIRDLSEAGKEPTLNEIAARQLIQISALTHALKPLVRDGLVELHPDPEDRRSKRAALTPEGLARLQQAVSRWAQANGRVETTLGPGVAEGLRALADLIASERFLDAYRSGRPLEGS